MQLKCGNCAKMFTASHRQEKTTRLAKKWQPKFGHMCSPACTGMHAVKQRKGVTPLPTDKLARCRLNNATASGVLVRPTICERCGWEPGFDSLGRSRIHGHHPDHRKPLAVEWICYLCHIEITPPARGERSGQARFNPQKIRRIRTLLSRGHGVNELGRLYGVTHKAISDIRDRKTWGHLL